MMDKISALAVPPGNSLTDAPGKWPWERPARFSNPDDVIDYTVDSISNGPVRDDMIKMMLAGITVEELVEQITFKGFMAGAFTPDVAELVKPAIGIFLADMAIQEGFEPQMFVDEGPIEGSVSDEAFFKIMKEKNPELFRTMLEETNRMQRQFDDMERSELDYAMQKEQKEEDLNNSFMRVEEKS
jgi:hypothetical protein